MFYWKCIQEDIYQIQCYLCQFGIQYEHYFELPITYNLPFRNAVVILFHVVYQSVFICSDGSLPTQLRGIYLQHTTPKYCYSYTYYTIVFRYHTKDLQHTLHSLVALQDGDSVNHFKRPVKRFGKLEAFLELKLSEQIRFCC